MSCCLYNMCFYSAHCSEWLGGGVFVVVVVVVAHVLLLFVYCVDSAYSCDPRVKQFKDAEKAEKEAKKKAKTDAAKKEVAQRKAVSV